MKVCPKCGINQIENSTYRCKQCFNLYQRIRRSEIKKLKVVEKIKCKGCQIEITPSWNTQKYCAECRLESRRKSRKKWNIKNKKWHLEYYKSNKEKWHEYRQRNIVKIHERQKQYRDKKRGAPVAKTFICISCHMITKKTGNYQILCPDCKRTYPSKFLVHNYIAHKLKRQGINNINDELIQLKRKTIKLKRLLNEHKQQIVQA